ncbi:RNA methyltransferase [Leptolyngbya sp. 'hensonii']|uniref:RNA methyltransferase n=1 Tax=Leptolyngbya sp. 'hensonii' TaxID=1922337 RepID=UPI00094F6EFB|nr:RNA methyltransferase [Leptolyngbya sp. 'hensonii']OLP20220.1 RNA methyltransferase [Leptolyngbya sp. 'hensonii']
MSEDALARIRIVLVEPAGPLNVGSIARVMKNMGMRHLLLVQPQCDPLGPEARQMAVHGADILEAATIVPDLPTALAGCQRAVATTGRDRSLPTRLEPPRQVLPWLLADPDVPLQSALIFGPEDRGLSNEELKYGQRFLQIPAHRAYPSLNLAQAVGICVYELHQMAYGDPLQSRNWLDVAAEDRADRATMDELEGYYEQLEALLLRIGYLYPHTAVSRMEKFRRLFNRIGLSKAELAMLRGILSQVGWALEQKGDE